METKKRYLDFIDNNKLQAAVNHLDASDKIKDYEDNIDKFLAKRSKKLIFVEGADPFFYKLYSSAYSSQVWLKAEIERQLIKKVEQRIGEFHQKVLGNADGWIDLGVGGGMDICNEEKTIFIELKNKSNTVNDGSGKTVKKNARSGQKTTLMQLCITVMLFTRTLLKGKSYGKQKENLFTSDFTKFGAQNYIKSSPVTH